MATNTSFSAMGPQSQYPQQLQPQQQPAENNASPLPAYMQQNQNAANPTQADLPGIPAMPGMNPESKVGGEQPQQQISLPPQANADSFTKKEATTPPSPAFGKKEKKDSCKDSKFGEEEQNKKEEFAPKAPKSPFAQAPSFGEEEE